ncbi:MAG TPA: cation:proton antiporter, partial [Candidatus Dormibacteraeota bacterium]|nr:cation:proton antiporter [Candidatus Dormibacteraeota bacterium]
VLLAALLVAGMLYALSLPLGVAWMLGAALAATDPVAVIALARSLRVPPRLLAIVEAESLFNDAIAVALVRARNLLISLAALVVGGLLGDLVARFCLAMRVRNVPVLWLFSVLGLYGASFGIEWLGGSGIVAVVAFGIAMRSRIEHGTARELLEGVDAYWRRCALALNVVLFAWMGASLNLADSEGVLLASVAVLVALALARLVMVYGLLRAVPEVASSWRAFMTASGMRGALSLALVLSIGAGVPGARRARAIAFVVVLSTMLVGALLLPRSTRALAD